MTLSNSILQQEEVLVTAVGNEYRHATVMRPTSISYSLT